MKKDLHPDYHPVVFRDRAADFGRSLGSGLARVRFREMAHRGELPGVTKTSW